jgi:hypothetical protein
MDVTQLYRDEAWSSPDLTQKGHYMIFKFDYVTELDGLRISVGDGGYITSFSVTQKPFI